jgi:hypothetical protein
MCYAICNVQSYKYIIQDFAFAYQCRLFRSFWESAGTGGGHSPAQVDQLGLDAPQKESRLAAALFFTTFRTPDR